jgi:hypothetical protein
MLLLRVPDLLLCIDINPALDQFLVLDLCQLVLVVLYGCIVVRLTIRCCSHVDDFCYHLLARHWLTQFALHFGTRFTCKMTIDREFVGLHIKRDLQARRIYLSQAMLIDSLLDKKSSGFMTCECLTGNDLRHNPGGALRRLRKWESLCP